jgi:hypothetical protein
VLAQHLVGIKIFRTRQRLRFGNARAEAIPRDHRRDRVKGVLVDLARRNQGGADARVKANLFIDGAAIGLKGAGIPAWQELRPETRARWERFARYLAELGRTVRR